MTDSIVLASSSPRRRELLARTGLLFTVDATGSDESLDNNSDSRELAGTLALAKAMAAAGRHPESLIISADTFGVLGTELLGKPVDDRQAADMLRKLSGKKHTVITGITVVDAPTGRAVTETVETDVYFRVLTDEEIESYVRSGEPLDKAGAYAIQGLGALLVDRIDGDYYNVVGLPLSALARILKEFGINLLTCARNGGRSGGRR